MSDLISKPILVVGGGLSGLLTAVRLHQAGLPVRLVEARTRLGGRILSAGVDGEPSDDGLDLGPSWFWPGMTPEILPLVEELGLTFVAQHTDGMMLFQRTRSGRSERYPGLRQEPASMRLVGGTGAMVTALASLLPHGSMRLGARVTRIVRSAEVVAVRLATDGGSTELIEAGHVVLALPPRLLEATVQFSPAASEAVRSLWRGTPTWMAPHAKFIAVYDQAFWRGSGLSGAAQSMVGPLVEIHDATTGSGKAALFGFVGVPAQNRMQAGSKAVVAAAISQLGEIFGEDALHPVATLYKDWAADDLTATLLDLSSAGHPAGGTRAWLDRDWLPWMTLAGSETSPSYPGYLAGAIEAGEAAAEALIRRYRNAASPADVQGMNA
ncbi:flavin monoamine oxidase family protein [Agrobacterium sp. P15N1-A]|uniref:flavin monoamine oxidase family protein n=1 Tax=Agrobacterium sp. P15N1-A TaxID=3342820 RepID=UPI0037D5F442